jgi:hypothetical protein
MAASGFVVCRAFSALFGPCRSFRVAHHTSAQRRTPPHSAALRRTPPHSAALRRSAPHSAALRRTPPHSAALRRSPPHSAALRRTPPLSAALRRSPPLSAALRRSPPLSAALRRSPPLSATLGFYLPSEHYIALSHSAALCLSQLLLTRRRSLLLLAAPRGRSFRDLLVASGRCSISAAILLVGVVRVMLPHRPWDRLRLPRGWSEILQPPAAAPPALPAPPIVSASRKRRRVPQGWSDLQDPALPPIPMPVPPPLQPSSWIFNDSAALFHHYIELHGCPDIGVQHLGLMDQQCPHCRALFFECESRSCCMKGTVHVPLPLVPPHLHALITSPEVMRLIRVYNMALSMASTGHNNVSPGWGMFTLGGKTFHRLSANFCNPCGPPNFAQIYMLDTTAPTTRRLEVFRSQGLRSSGAALQADVLTQLHLIAAFLL